MRTSTKAWALAMALAAGACAGDGPSDADREVRAAPVVDSVLPMEVMVMRFRAGLDEPTRLGHGADSRDELVERVVAALQAADTAALEAVAVDRAEFAWLYFPSSSFARPPYELPPALSWFRIQERNRAAVLRALHELGGRPLRLDGYTCSPEPLVEGENRIWTGCSLRIMPESGAAVSLPLFGSILERDGRFAVLGYADDF